MKTPKPDTFPLLVTKGHAVAKIYKGTNRGKDIFTLSYVGPGGRVRQNFADLAEAKREADSAVAKMQIGDLQALRLTGRDAQLFVAATDALRPCGVSIDIACREFAQAFEILGFDGIIEAARHYQKTVTTGLPDITVQEAVQQFHDEKKQLGKSTKYLKDIRQILGAVDPGKIATEERTGGLSGTFKCQLRAITKDDLKGYIARLKMGPVAKNNHRRLIGGLFNYAKKSGWLAEDKTTSADALGYIDVADTDPEIFTPSEMAALLASANESFLPYLALVAFGGLRADEIRDDLPKPGKPAGQLRWEDIDFQRGTILVPAAIAKTGKKRKITMPENLKAWLAPYNGRKGFIYSADPSDDRARTVKAAAKILGRGPESADPFKWKNNGHRHSFASYRLQQTLNEGQVALEMGNSAKMVRDHYADVGVHLEDAIAYFSIAPLEDGKVTEIGKAA
jgi:integrase